jgi:hypothetical protein
MANKPTLRQAFDKLLAKYDPEIRKAFLKSIEGIKSRVVLKLVIERLQKNDLYGVLEALNLERAAFTPVENAIAQAYGAGGTTMADYLPALYGPGGARLVVIFDVRNPAAETWLRDHSSNLITSILEDQRASIRSVLELGMSQGQNPRTVALDIVGRISSASGKREGGIVGLTNQQTQYVIDAKNELLSGDETLMRNYLNRTLRDKRFDSTVLKAIKNGETLDSATVDKLAGRYADSLLRLRGETIGRTEALGSLNSSKYQTFLQGLGKTDYPPEAVIKTWRSAGDRRVRHSHQDLNGQEVVGIDTAFQSSTGALMKYPHDTSLGAGARDVIACRCEVDYTIDYSFGLS